MITVVSNRSEEEVVREFFELFKTPWQFYREDCNPEVLLCSGLTPPPTAARLVLLYTPQLVGALGEPEHTGDVRPNRVLQVGEDKFPVYGACRVFASAFACLVDEASGRSAAIETRKASSTVVHIGFDLFGEVRRLLEAGQPEAHASIPTLDLHINCLREILLSHSVALVEIPPLPWHHDFIACLTHDIDHARVSYHKWDRSIAGFLFRAFLVTPFDLLRGRKVISQLLQIWKAALMLPFVYLGWARDFWDQFARYLEIEKGLTSTFFFVPAKDEPGLDERGRKQWKRAVRYALNDVAADIQDLRAAGREIAVHGIDAWRDETKGHAELDRIREYSESQEVGIRMHWLFFGPNSPALLEAAGFSYDSTSGFNGRIGYRAGTAQVFKPLPVRALLELPLHIMDTALFFPSHMHLSEMEAKLVIKPITEHARRFGGVVTINWHDRSLGPERLWDRSYIDLIETLRAKNPWFATAADTVAWFRKRRSASFAAVERDKTTLRVKLESADKGALPSLRVRVYHPSDRRPTSGWLFTDRNLDENEGFLIAA